MARAIDRTSQLFVNAVRAALPDAQVWVQRSRTSWGRSHYVYIQPDRRRPAIKVRISDHPVGMRRALSGECALHLPAGAKPASWAVWLGELVRAYEGQSAGR